MRILEAARRERRWGLALLLLAALGLDTLRALTVPAGLWNIDEAYHFADLQNAARQLAYEIRRGLGAGEPPPAPLPGGVIGDPSALFHPPGWVPIRGAAYHLLQALPQLLLTNAPDAARLLVARLVSALLHLAVIGLTYSTLRRLLPRGAQPWAPLAGAILAAFIPSYSDMMSAVNLDVGAAAAGALYLWSLVRLIREGFRLKTAAILAAAAALGISAKETFWPLLPATAAALLWCWAGRQARAASALALAAAIAAAFLVFDPLGPGGAADWFSAEWEYGRDAALAPRIRTDAPAGAFALRSDDSTPDGILQFVPETGLGRLRGQTVTWGVWLRASRPTETTIGLTAGDDWLAAGTALAGPDWQFHAASARLEGGFAHLALLLSHDEDGPPVEFDGAVLVVGEYPTGVPPAFADGEATHGQWGGQPFENLLLNPSGEAGWPQFKEAFNARPLNLNTRLNALLAWRRTAPALAGLARWLLANFWSGFGGLLPGLTARQMIPLALLSAWAGLGAATIFLRDFPKGDGLGRERTARLGLWALTAVAAAAWLMVLYRSDFVPNTANIIVWAVTRHASGGLSATAALLALGLLRWLPRRAQPWAVAALALGLFALNVWILLGVQLPFIRCPSPLPTDCLPTVH